MNKQKQSARATWTMIAGIAAVFFALRVALAWARQPFFDELFTLWIVRKPFGGILEALRHDSGPPLYYFFVHALSLHSIDAIRIASLIAATATLAIVLAARPFGRARFMAAALLAVYPPAVLFAIDARAYALCAMLVAAGIVALWSDRPFVAAAAFVAAAYSHYYGALFFPLLLLPLVIPSVSEGSGRAGGARTEGDEMRAAHPPRSLAHARDDRRSFNFQFSIFNFAPFAAALLCFLPGAWLAFHQPRAAMLWLHEPRSSWVNKIWFAGDYPYALFAPAPAWLVIVAAALFVTAIIVAARTARTPLLAFTGFASVIPLLGATILGVYFPMRFESVLAVPLTLWIAVSLELCSPVLKRALFAALLIVGLFVCGSGIADHARRPIDDYRAAALWTSQHVRPDAVVVASGYCYLEAATFVHARVLAMPPEQAVHPGWRAFATPNTPIPAGPFVWIGERAAPELSILRKARGMKPLYLNDRAIVAAVR